MARIALGKGRGIIDNSQLIIDKYAFVQGFFFNLVGLKEGRKNVPMYRLTAEKNVPMNSHHAFDLQGFFLTW